MPYNGSGLFSTSPGNFPAVAGTVITSAAYNAVINDLANNGLSNVITRDGQGTPTADIPWNSKKITGLALGVAATDAANLQNITNGLIFNQAGTNPTPLTTQNKLRQIISAADFVGFDPTGVSDSTVAVQNALNLASALGGGSVSIPGSARVRVCTSVTLTIPAHCALVGPYTEGGVDTNTGGNLDFPWGTMGGCLILATGAGRVILCQGLLDGLLLMRTGMTFPVTTAGSDYANDAVNLGGNGASVTNCMFLGFARAIYSRNFQRIRIDNCKFDCTKVATDACIDIRQAGDTSTISNCSAWPYAGAGSPVATNAGAVRGGSFIQLAGANDWTQVNSCQEYGYFRGIRLCNEANDSAVIVGPANVRVNQFRSDDGWGGTAPYHSGKIAILLSGDTTSELGTQAKAFDVLINGLQSSCSATAAIYTNIEAGMKLAVSNSFSWNGPQFGLVYQNSGDLIVMGGGNRGDGPGDPTAYGTYSLTYAVASGLGRTLVGGGFRSSKVTTAHFRVGVATDSYTIDFPSVTFDTSAPVHDGVGSVAPSLATVADMSTLLRRPDNQFYLTGTATITSLGTPTKGRRLSFICASGMTFTNNANMRVNGNANFTTAAANTFVEFLGYDTFWRMVAVPSA